MLGLEREFEALVSATTWGAGTMLVVALCFLFLIAGFALLRWFEGGPPAAPPQNEYLGWGRPKPRLPKATA